jgi:hypothetical protein
MATFFMDKFAEDPDSLDSSYYDGLCLHLKKANIEMNRVARSVKNAQ